MSADSSKPPVEAWNRSLLRRLRWFAKAIAVVTGSLILLVAVFF